MKSAKFFFILFLTLAIFYVFNTKLGSIPPVGKFLDPAHGAWQNEWSEDSRMDDIVIPGLSAPVNVHYDENLIPHVFAQNDEDLYRAQGYLTAMHRLWQMEFQTHAAAGRISELIGPDALNYDREQRRRGMGFGAEQSLEAMKESPEIMNYLEAYRDGVNGYIDGLEPGDYPVEYKLLDYAPEHWTLKKTALLLMYMTKMLAGGDSDLEYTNFLKKYGKERFDLLYPDFFDVNDPIIPADTDWSSFGDVQIPEVPFDSLPSSGVTETIHDPNPDNGSNNWAVAPSKSATGNAILANDPHLGLNLPSIWFAMQLATPEKNTFGVTLPGALGVAIGFNNDIAWGMTNATRDVADWYKIEFQDAAKSTYRYNGQWKPTTQRIEEIKVRGQETYRDTVYYTHHGPVTYDETFMGDNERAGYALKWIGHMGGSTQLTLLQLNEAKNYDDYVNALKHYVAPAQNFIFSSTSGDIAIWIQGLFPNKWKGQGKFLMDGSNPANDWQGFIPQEHNAHIKNPERGFVSSANQHPVDASYPYYVFNDGYETYRNRVINDFFRKKEKYGIQDFKDLQNNNYNLKASELIPFMLDTMDVSSLNDAEKEVLDEIRNWDFNNDIDKKGPVIWDIWYYHLTEMTYDELETDSLAYDRPFTYQTIHLYKNNPDDAFMDILETDEKETAPVLFVLSFKEAVKELSDWQKENGDYNWGAYKATHIGHLLQGLPAFSRFDLPIGGGRNIVNATTEDHGPSWRMIVEMSSPPKAQAIYPGGQSGNPGSKFYDNFVDRWAAGEYLDILFMQTAEDTSAIRFSQTLNPAE